MNIQHLEIEPVHSSSNIKKEILFKTRNCLSAATNHLDVQPAHAGLVEEYATQTRQRGQLVALQSLRKRGIEGEHSLSM